MHPNCRGAGCALAIHPLESFDPLTHSEVAPGYEDLNDHESLRHDPVFDALLGKLTAKHERCAALAGKSCSTARSYIPLSRPTNQKPQPCHRRTAAAHGGALASAKNALPAPRPLNLPSAAHRSTCRTDESENLSGSEKWRLVALRIRCAVHELRRRRPQREPLFARNGSVSDSRGTDTSGGRLLCESDVRSAICGAHALLQLLVRKSMTRSAVFDSGDDENVRSSYERFGEADELHSADATLVTATVILTFRQRRAIAQLHSRGMPMTSRVCSTTASGTLQIGGARLASELHLVHVYRPWESFAAAASRGAPVALSVSAEELAKEEEQKRELLKELIAEYRLDDENVHLKVGGPAEVCRDWRARFGPTSS